MQLGLEEIRQLVDLLHHSDLSELSVEAGDIKIALKKGTSAVMVAPPHLAAPMPSQGAAPAHAPSAPPPPPSAKEENVIQVRSPMVGTFYRSPSPDSPPFVDVGSAVEPGQTVCIIEAMKLMNEIEAEHGGRIKRILVNNGDPVEYGQVLVEIEP
ncbi:MAG: acetyl-CoA carboxylase biotin carboxyl carrier protein [Cyanobacteria bacterium REEB65]|nr:acetyl-CoA carboxylase biotin carboxyl carrier protein [Cyanobacteria bacterium REEB65]